MKILNVNIYDGGWGGFKAYVLDMTSGIRTELDEPYRINIKSRYSYDNAECAENMREVAKNKHFDGVLVVEDSTIIWFEVFESQNMLP